MHTKSEPIKRIIIDVADGAVIINKIRIPLSDDGGRKTGSFQSDPDPFESFEERPRPLIDACDNCDVLNFCDDDIYLPPCILKKAGMSPDADFVIAFCGGGIYITEDIGYDGDDYCGGENFAERGDADDLKYY